MKALVVSYLPRGDQSHTKLLMDCFDAETKEAGIEVEHLNLLESQPDFFDHDRVMAYSLRNYMGQTLPPEQAALMSKMDRMTEQLKEADAVVVVFPMYNFSMPALVKAYFDSVMLKGETWDINDNGYAGLMKGKKALILLTSGGDYTKPGMEGREHAVSLARTCFQFMGYSQIDDISIGGANSDPDVLSDKITASHDKIKGIISGWAKQ